MKPSKSKDSNEPKLSNSFETRKPSIQFDSLVLSEALRQEFNDFINLHKNGNLIYEKWNLKSILPDSKGKLVLNFSGPPGTGKTCSAEALAYELGLNYMSINYSMLESKYVGDTAKNIAEAFMAARHKKALIHWDEADTILGKRLTSVTSAADHGVNTSRTTMLIELERHEGPVVFSTNLITNYDPAFERRIHHFINFKLPEADERREIFKTLLPEQLPTSEQLNFDDISEKTNGFSPADIKKLILLSAIEAASLKNSRAVNNQIINNSIKKIRSGKTPFNEKSKIIKEEIIDIE